MSITIEELKIKFLTNLKSKDQRTVEFKLSMLHHPELGTLDKGLNEYPYFTFDLKYPMYNLKALPYKERVEFFFSRDAFNDRLITYATSKNILDKSKLENESTEQDYYRQRDKNIQKNIMYMLELLFPTQFPVINDLQTSHNVIFENTTINKINVDPMISNYYSYLKLNGQTHTFKKVIWVNDILNHPIYQKLLSEYNKFWNWSVTEKAKHMKVINKYFPRITEEMKKMFYYFIIEKKYKIKGDPVATTNSILWMIELCYLFGVDKLEMIKILNNLDNSHSIKQMFENKFVTTYSTTFFNDKINEFEEKNVSTQDKFNRILLLLEKSKLDVRRGGILKDFQEYSILEDEQFKKTIIAIENYMNIDIFFKKTYNNLSNENKTMPMEYKNFAFYILNEYKKPVRESSNVFLQELLNLNQDNNVVDFYNFMHYLLNKYISSGNESIPYREDFVPLMNIGLSFINMMNASSPQYEIYVYTDFIEGEINSKNVKDIFCPFVNDHLGNQLDILLKKSLQGKTSLALSKKWNIMSNRMIFSIKEFATKKEQSKKSSDNLLILNAKPITDKDINFKNVANKEKVDDVYRLNLAFTDKILSNNSDLESALNKLDDYPNVAPIQKAKILELIKNKEYKLYYFIKKWDSNMSIRNEDIINGLIKLISEYEGQKKIKEKERNDPRIQLDTKKKSDLSYDIDILNMYIAIANKLKDSEQLKQPENPIKGGLKKTKRNFKKKIFKITRKLHKTN